MTAQGKLSADGRIIVRTDGLVRRGWRPGTEFDVPEKPDGLSLMAKSGAARPDRLTSEALDRRRPRYDRPPVAIEEMGKAVVREAARRWRAKEAQPVGAVDTRIVAPSS